MDNKDPDNKNRKAGISRRNLLKGLAVLPFMQGLVCSASGNTNSGEYNRLRTSEDFNYGSVRGPGGLPVGHPVNQPLGQPVGIFPGRVVWVWDKSAARTECSNTVKDDGPDFWFQDKNTDQARVTRMISTGIQRLTGKSSDSESWDAIFRFYNKKNGKGDAGYKQGEKIFLKLNFTSAFSMHPGTMGRNYESQYAAVSETSPQMVTAVLRQLVHRAGVPQNAIFVGDPQRNIFQESYEKFYSEFPGVNYLGNNIHYPDAKILENGRTPLTISDTAMIYYSDKGSVMPDVNSDKLYGIFDEMEYMLNIPQMKGHNASGITVFPKNHFGSQARQSASHLHDGLNRGREGYGKYRVIVDIMGSEYLGRKNLVYILDALWPGADWGDPPVKFRMDPFNDDWASSVFFSFDQVAIESVAFDFLRTELDGNNKYTDKAFPNYPGCDDNLHQAASEATWPHGIIYAPNRDGKKISSLGVHEHWNNPVDKKYSRNLGTGSGIELIPVFV
jgi:hypothetical protein